MKSRRYVLGGYATWWAVLVALYYGLPGLRAETWGLIGLSGVSGIVAGVAINRPSRKLPWLLLAAALTSFTAGQVSFLVAQLIGIQLPFPSFADVLYLLTYPLYASGLPLMSAFDSVAAIFDRNGKYMGAINRKVAVHWSDDDAGVQTATTFSFLLDPGPYLVRMVVRDSESQRLSAQAAIVEIP